MRSRLPAAVSPESFHTWRAGWGGQGWGRGRGWGCQGCVAMGGRRQVRERASAAPSFPGAGSRPLGGSVAPPPPPQPAPCCRCGHAPCSCTTAGLPPTPPLKHAAPPRHPPAHAPPHLAVIAHAHGVVVPQRGHPPDVRHVHEVGRAHDVAAAALGPRERVVAGADLGDVAQREVVGDTLGVGGGRCWGWGGGGRLQSGCGSAGWWCRGGPCQAPDPGRLQRRF
jgi:hypothetical protein